MHKHIPIDQIRIDGGTQPRTEINLDVVADYAEILKSAFLPDVDVFFDGTAYWLADGFHRYHAHRKAELKEVPCWIYEGTRREAQLFSLGVNAEHGLRRTNADKRKAVLTMLQDDEWKSWSDRKIADHCRVSRELVGDIRREVESQVKVSLSKLTVKNAKTDNPVTVSSDSDGVIGPTQEATKPNRLPALPPAETRNYTTKHGTTASMNVSRIGKPAGTIPSPPPWMEAEVPASPTPTPAVVEPSVFDGLHPSWRLPLCWAIHLRDSASIAHQIVCKYKPFPLKEKVQLVGEIELYGLISNTEAHTEPIWSYEIEDNQTLEEYTEALAADLVEEFQTKQSTGECTAAPAMTQGMAQGMAQGKAPVAPVKPKTPIVFDTKLVEEARHFESRQRFLEKGTLLPFVWNEKFWLVTDTSVEIKPPQRVLSCQLREIITMEEKRARGKIDGDLSYELWPPRRQVERDGLLTSDEKWYLTDNVRVVRREDFAPEMETWVTNHPVRPPTMPSIVVQPEPGPPFDPIAIQKPAHAQPVTPKKGHYACPACLGSGTFNDADCQTCWGKAWLDPDAMVEAQAELITEYQRDVERLRRLKDLAHIVPQWIYDELLPIPDQAEKNREAYIEWLEDFARTTYTNQGNLELKVEELETELDDLKLTNELRVPVTVEYTCPSCDGIGFCNSLAPEDLCLDCEGQKMLPGAKVISILDARIFDSNRRAENAHKVVSDFLYANFKHNCFVGDCYVELIDQILSHPHVLKFKTELPSSLFEKFRELRLTFSEQRDCDFDDPDQTQPLEHTINQLRFLKEDLREAINPKLSLAGFREIEFIVSRINAESLKNEIAQTYLKEVQPV